MVEIYEDIRQEVKDTAAAIWEMTIAQNTPTEAAKLLNTIVNYYKLIWTDKEVEFLQFYFKMRMEMINND